MKISIYHATRIKLVLLAPTYTGYRSLYIGSHADPANCATDYPTYIRKSEPIVEQTGTLHEIAPWPHEMEVIKDILFGTDTAHYIEQSLQIYEDTLLFSRHHNFLSKIGSNFLMAVLTMIGNINTNGNGILAYKFHPILYDIIYLLSYMFHTIKITRYYIICEGYRPAKMQKFEACTLINFIKYFIAADCEVHPILKNPDETKIKRIIKALN